MTFTFGNWLIRRIVVGELQVNCYIVTCGGADAFVFDPGDEAQRIISAIAKEKLALRAIINTHGHGDHIGGNEGLMKATGAPLWIGRNDAPLLADAHLNMSAAYGAPIVSPPAGRLLDEGDVIELGAGSFKVFDIPGHSPGSLVFVADKFAIVGDAIFAGSIGRTDFAGGSMNTLLKNIRAKVLVLKDDCVLLPGHGPETTVAAERSGNPFLQPGFDQVW